MTAKRCRTNVIAALVGFAFFSSTDRAWAQDGFFTPTGSAATPREFRQPANLVLLQDGRAFIAGQNSAKDTMTNRADIYDPASGTWSPTGSMNGAKDSPCIALADGRVLVPGSPTEIWNPATGTFSNAPGSFGGRHSSGTLLRDGRVLVTDGQGASAALFDSTTGLFSATANNMSRPGVREAVPLNDGRVLLLNVSDGAPGVADIYDPPTNLFTATGPTNSAHVSGKLTRLADGRALATGGPSTSRTAEVFDPSTACWTPTGSLVVARSNHVAVLLASGEVLVVGGRSGSTVTATAELYNPATGTFSLTGSMSVLRAEHGAVLLRDGRVLVYGGEPGDAPFWSTAEIYTPGPAARIQGLIALIQDFNLSHGIANSLSVKLANALKALRAPNAATRRDATNHLTAFINAVEAQRGKALTGAQATTLVQVAEALLLQL